MVGYSLVSQSPIQFLPEPTGPGTIEGLVSPYQAFFYALTEPLHTHTNSGNSGGVEMWRGGLGWHIRCPTLSVVGVSLAIPYSVSTSRSSNLPAGRQTGRAANGS